MKSVGIMTSIGDLICVFCNETFDDKETLQIHFRKHGDPNYNQTKRFCDSKMSGDKSNEPGEMVNCDVCSEVFPTISKAITHKHKLHPNHDAKYFCSWCGKLFTMKHLYNKHIQTNHAQWERTDDNTFHCDNCDVDFYTASAMLCHNKFFHRQDSDLPSIGISKKQKLYDQEAISIYYCPFCGEEYENKVNLHKHMADDHSDEDQSPQEKLKCPLCDALFYHLDAYEIHLTYHSNDDYYSDQNELRNEITEYSLETVAPIIKNKSQEQNSPMEIDQFLQLAMGESNDNVSKKSKKHKKHKKSKKSITLDEFLNMNKDVFGEELDVHSVEEVPTTVVARRLKASKRLPQKTPTRVVTSDLQKLKQQGIVVRKKQVPNISQSHTGLNRTLKLSKDLTTNKVLQFAQNKNNPNSLNTSNEVLSRLLNQTNSQIKIVKKAVQASNSEDKIEEHNSDIEGDTLPDIPTEKELTQENSPEPEHNTDSDTEYEEQHNTKESNIVSKTQDEDTEMASELGKPSSLSAKDDSSHCADLQTADKGVDFSNCVINKDTDIKHDDSEQDEISNENSHLPKDGVDEESRTELTEDGDHSLNEMSDDEDIPDGNEPKDSNSNNSLSALKHLGHLIIKPVSNNNAVADKGKETVVKSNTNPNISPTTTNNMPLMNKSQHNSMPQRRIDVLRKINKNISIKSITQSDMKYNDDEGSDCDDMMMSGKPLKISGNNSLSVADDDNQPHLVQTINMSKINTMNKNSIQRALHSPKPINNTIVEKPEKELFHNQSKDQTNANLLKRLTNITAKPLNKHIIDRTNMPNKLYVCPNKNVRYVSKEIDDDIEIFNIDDSDSDDNKESEKINENADLKYNEPRKPAETLKCLSKNITIKNVKQQPNKNVVIKEEPKDDAYESEPETNEQFKNKPANENIQLSAQHKSNALNNVLKCLGKNITLKSRNNSPCHLVTSQDNNTQDFNAENSDESDVDSYSDKVKITEIDNDDFSEEEKDTKQEDEVKEDTVGRKAVIQSPDDSCSDQEDGMIDDDFADFEDEPDMEKQIKVHKLMKTNDFLPASKKPTPCLNSLKGISKDITIKSLNDKQPQSRFEDSKEFRNSPNKDNIKVNSLKQVKRFDRNEQGNGYMTQSSSNQIECINNSSNQTNTVNKEVTVKTFQTQTVIQEITTTVTKTIRTVNQSMNQVHNQSISKTIGAPQRVQGVRPSMHIGKNIQGLTVRQRSPTIGSKIQNATSLNRPVVGSPVRPSNQIVTLRPGLNVPRQNPPRMPIIQKQPVTPHQQIIGRNLKISPHAITSAVNKRKTFEDTNGPFGCFKKPKETLLTGSDSSQNADESNMANVHFSSNSHCSKSNVSTQKIVKGNSIITSTNMKSQVSATSQQLSRLSNVSGLKIVKTSQKQEQVQENCEKSANQTTLDAIEKLQKQGLLVKKPRLDVNEDSNHSEPEDDYNAEYSSTEDNDNY